ncbi:GNAT family N-acetyltransferase [Lacrimispora sp.]|jgi:ribosomal protein S18 acetylase RimI-like enzyme|uniref:GNAT family N-acetyltransferase n=1 Tax=Lacrimispora sp. TaxID=2719234 RepID=UPI002897463A|nr:GNAT family N-acetyltransferase [Lacrimispora sp.]
MIFLDLNKENAGTAYELFEDAVRAKEVLFRPFENQSDFCRFFMENQADEVHKITILEEHGWGFASGCFLSGESRAYLSMIAVKKEMQRQEIGKTMLACLEDRLRKESGVSRIEIVFFNPMTFSWYIPGKKTADHPNAPGVDVGSNAYLFFKNCRYRDYAMQNSYYLALDDYSVPDFAAVIAEGLEKEDITIEVYDSHRHYGMEAMMHKFQNPLWERDILGETAKGENSRPILIAAHNGKVIGFTGPLDVEESGRGYFCGIGVDPGYRGKKISTVLFCRLCISLKEMGADFMSLFTGENNPARNIYEAAGFRIVRTWADMRKEWKDG